jgi:hypothetical protein
MVTETRPKPRGQTPIISDYLAARELVAFLRQKQDENGWTAQETADLLGISRPYWVAVCTWADSDSDSATGAPRSGWAMRPGLALLTGAIGKFPEWHDRIKAMIRPDYAALLA